MEYCAVYRLLSIMLVIFVMCLMSGDWETLEICCKWARCHTIGRLDVTVSYDTAACLRMNAPTLINRSFADEPHLADLAAELLRSPQALPELNADDARRVVGYTRLIRVHEGEVLTREGEPAGNGFMLLLIDGEVTVDNFVANQAAPVVVSVLGPGHLIGETALIDGGPRTATCTATTDIIGAGLSRNAVLRMIAADPEVSVKLMTGISVRMAERLRAVNRQQRIYHQLLTAMQGEIDALQRQLQQVVDGSLARAQRHAGEPGGEA